MDLKRSEARKVEIRRVSITCKGIVQGVGFRPFIYKIARKYDLLGWVCNSSGGGWRSRWRVRKIMWLNSSEN